MNYELRVALCRSITARALLYGAESADFLAQADEHSKEVMDLLKNEPAPFTASTTAERTAIGLRLQAAAARRRYWRELAACELLHGRRWPEAEALGVGP
ncbi:MAG: hypothetical protein RI906_2308 [Pseudomonadota bacterium]|jgi:hypothetical protein